MIVKLLDRMVEILRDEFAGVINTPASHILVGAAADPQVAALPLITFSLGALTFPQTTRDTTSSQPRPQPFSEEIPVSAATPQGPYTLAKTPLKGSLLCKLILDKGTLDERQVLFIENSDFTIDYPNAQIEFITPISGASSILLRYSFVGVFTVQDFQQDVLLDVYDASDALVEQWTALTLAAIATNADELLDNYNSTNKTSYSAGLFGSTHTLTQFQPLGGAPAQAAHSLHWQLTFIALGQLTLTKASPEGFALIQKIRSPGRHSNQPVDIDAGLE